MAIKTLRKFWKKATSNPLYAIGAISAGGALYSMFDPKGAAKAINFLEMGDVEEPYDVYGQVNYTTGLRGYGPNLGQGDSRREFLGTNTRMVPRKSIFGTTGGLGYDIQKKIGSIIATPLKFGSLFSRDGAGYSYLFGDGKWADFKKGLQGSLPFSVAGKEAREAAAEMLGLTASGAFSGGNRGSGGGGGIQPIRSRRGSIGVEGTRASLRASPWQSYNANGMSANLLRTAYKDEYLPWVDRQTRSVTRIGPNINFRTSIKVGGRYTRTRS